MECLKIYSGEIEEITDLIIHYLRHDIKSLHSCILVNQILCRVTIPILWEDPFSVICPRGYSYNLLDTYLKYLSQDDKEKLKELGIIIHSPTFKRRLFNYPGFIKVLNITRVEVYIVSWPLLNDPSPLKLRSLKGVGLFPGIAISIQLVGPYLEYLELTFLEDPARNVALESIIKHCDKIIFLSLSCFDEKDAHLCNKIIHMNNHLRYLTIENEPFSYNRTDSGLLKKLKILPNRLDYLNLKFTFDPNDLKLFLDNCKHLVGLKNLLVRNYSCYDGIDTFKLLKNL
ncbi:14433_t:CDS:2 [Funneliformis caledonium]|uniref:14433_t:CDS:1 n=1 Tax=Funneliformis caledonium TaxID=1117310 RepID=A0A9N9A6W5_9GLOM|nr:14433_t:CDS:2 [Funneliformis caledonium]